MRMVHATILSTALGLLHPALAQACSCEPLVGPLEALASADLVFFGTVKSTNPPIPSVSPSPDWTPEYWEFAVEGVWKGAAQSRIRIHSEAAYPTISTCEFNFQLGSSYLVYAYRSDAGRFQTNKCTRTSAAAHSVDDLKALGSPRHRFRPQAAQQGAAAAERQ